VPRTSAYSVQRSCADAGKADHPQAAASKIVAGRLRMFFNRDAIGTVPLDRLDVRGRTLPAGWHLLFSIGGFYEQGNQTSHGD
jgi:hypothetical protein